MMDFIEDHPIITILAVVLMIAGLGVLFERNMNARCDRIMSFAHTSADSMHATIACEQMRADAERTAAIAAAAGAVAGSGAGGQR